ncbi:uncharacterized protein J4E79_010229 [Alternaria viburni]|uniref:uncharacterized protein n=1 Tax=Alternaria viburni TaxID=566460 RepID=UPI0020C233B7|nr:uncharacterized protein J4E79_010229 [Alternaria viburni]KAI4647371.1 hypothetical protein J4E79_010229 [Alternaria viburni]
MFQSICQGQLGLRHYGQQLRAVALKRDGSGGILNWGTTPATPKSYQCPGHFQANPDYLNDFIAEDNGSRLRLVTRQSTPLTLLTLPDSIQGRIFSMVVHPIEGTPIDLDHYTKFKCGLVHINRHFYRTWRDKFLFDNKFVLTMSTKHIQTTFDDFNNLRTFLRKTYMPKSHYSNGDPDTITARIVNQDKVHRQPGPSYVLRFELDSAISLADVRINALPLVMETSTTQASNTVTFQIWTTPGTDGPATMTASHTMTLHQLRLKIVLAIMRHVYSIPLYNRDELPDFWINGFGDVVPTPPPPPPPTTTTTTTTTNTRVPCDPTGSWHPASSLIYNADWDEDNYSISELHPIDYVYRNNGWGFHPQCVYPDSIHWQLFPFCKRTKEVLPYLVRCLDEAGLPDDEDGTFGQ